ncbi:MAG: uroporphyrinogen decarboxylase family protein [Armatimonadetes bacterium]|nr:uroporphyrinogen decarboxylase family protein [Armatimonadota bacterium]
MFKSREKTDRLRSVLAHKEADRVPVGEFFWTGFMRRCKEKWGDDFDPYRHFDLDYIAVNPNMDPKIRQFEVIHESGDDIVIRTGFGATIRRSGVAPMPHYESFSVATPDAMETFEFDDPADPRRFFEGGDDQINCVGDTLLRNLPPWNARVDAFVEDFAVFGSVCDPYEYLWRCIGTENALYWMASHPDMFAHFVNRVGEFNLALCKAQIEAGKGRLAGMYIWGDVAYCKAMLFGAPRWRKLFKPHVKALIDLCHEHGLMVIYHGCGNVAEIFDDMVEIQLDAYNPLEAKAGLDVVELKKQYAGRLAFCGNIDMQVLERGNPDEVRKHVLYKLRAAIGGGWVFQSDHSVSSAVSPETYELAINTLREFGNYPLSLPDA